MLASYLQILPKATYSTNLYEVELVAICERE